MKKIESIKIYGKLWFQRLYGNTYHSVTVIVNNEEILFKGFTYGYGNQFLQTAVDLLNEAGYSTTYSDLIKIADYKSKEVSRKKDLYKEIF